MFSGFLVAFIVRHSQSIRRPRATHLNAIINKNNIHFNAYELEMYAQ